MKLYKLTDEHGQTRNRTQWGAGITHTATGDSSQNLCSDGWIHAYENPLVAVFMNPAYADFSSPRLWEAKGIVGKRDGQIKCGCRSLTTIKEISLPVVTSNQRTAFAILCALKVCKNAAFSKWAKSWLSGKDRSAKAANAAKAAYAAYAADAADAAANAATYATDAANAANVKIPVIYLAKKAARGY